MFEVKFDWMRRDSSRKRKSINMRGMNSFWSNLFLFFLGALKVLKPHFPCQFHGERFHRWDIFYHLSLCFGPGESSEEQWSSCHLDSCLGTETWKDNEVFFLFIFGLGTGETWRTVNFSFWFFLLRHRDSIWWKQRSFSSYFGHRKTSNQGSDSLWQPDSKICEVWNWVTPLQGHLEAEVVLPWELTKNWFSEGRV